MSLTSDLVSDIEEFNSDVAARITEIAASSIGSALTSKSKKSKGIEDTNNFIHLVELCLMKKALSEVFEGNPVLVETFARDFEGRIVVEDKRDGDVMTQIPEVHTVLLYKMPGAGNNQVLIIDPSNSDYTKHFVLGHNKALIENAVSEVGVELIAPSKKVQIYKHPEGVSVGPGADQARDCIDIAVKLAFEIVVHSANPLLNVDSLKSWLPIVHITNNSKIDKAILFPGLVERIKQNSDNLVSSKFSMIMKKFYDLIKMVKSSEIATLEDVEVIFESRFKELMEKEGEIGDYTQLLQTDTGSDSIVSIYLDFNQAVRDSLQAEEIGVLGGGE